MTDSPDRLRLDKWLWYARFFKSRSLAAERCKKGLRVNGSPVRKASYLVGVGDILTFMKADHIRVVKILACGQRRGPAVEAQGLYEDLSPPAPSSASAGSNNSSIQGAREGGSGRPTKADRRAIDRFTGND